MAQARVWRIWQALSYQTAAAFGSALTPSPERRILAARGLVVLKGKLHVDGHAVAVLAALGRVEAGVHAAEPAGLLNPAHTVVGAVEGGGAHAGRLVAEHAGFAEPGDQRLVLARVVGDAGHFTAAAVVADRAAA